MKHKVLAVISMVFMMSVFAVDGRCADPTEASAAVRLEPRRLIENDAFFKFNRDATFIGHDAELLNELQNTMSAYGVESGRSFLGRLFSPKVALYQCDNIEGYDASTDALYIDVRNNKLSIYYTSKKSCRRAFAMLESISRSRESDGLKGLIGCQAIDWMGGIRTRGAASLAKVSSAHGGAEIDAASSFMSKTELEGIIRKKAPLAQNNGSNALFLEVVNHDNWRLESSVFSLINPNESIYPENKYYTASHINQLLQVASNERVTLIPTIDLFSDNKPFQEFTGHSLWSVEGMRFLRRIIEDYAQNVNCHKICLGDPDLADSVDPQYVEFVQNLLSKNSLEWVK